MNYNKGHDRPVDANFYDRMQRRWADKPEKKLSPEEWDELKERLEGNELIREICHDMSRGRTYQFIEQCVAKLGIDIKARNARIKFRKRHDAYMEIYNEHKAEIDAAIAKNESIDRIRRRYSISRKFIEQLVVDLGYDLERYIFRCRIKANRKAGEGRAKQIAKAKIKHRVDPYSNERMIALAMPWVSKETPNQFHYWYYGEAA